MLMKNDTGHRIRIPCLKVDLAPGECKDLPDGYCLPRRSPGGARIPCVVENLGPGMRPADALAFAEWSKAPPADNAVIGTSNPAKTKEAFVREGLPEGIAEIKAARDKVRADQEKATAQMTGLGTEPRVPDPVLMPAHTPAQVSETPIVAKTARKGTKKE